MLAHVLLRLARIYGDDELERRALPVPAARPRRARAGALGVRLGALRARPPLRAAARARDRRAARERRRARGAARLDPARVVAFGPGDGVPLLAGKGLVGGQPAVYACESFAYLAPVTDPAQVQG